MIVSPRRISWGVWPLWAAAGTLGGALGAAYWDSARLPNTIPNIGFLLHEAALVLSMLVMLALPGFLQWLILRRTFPQPQARWWILTSATGSLMGFFFVAWAVAVADTEPGGPAFAAVAFAALVLLGGAAAGALQWLAALPWLTLRRWAASAGWWLLASSIGWLGATWLFLCVTRAGDAQPAWLYFILGGAASGAFAAAITGLALVWLLHNGRMKEPSTRARAA
jgi:hypothetical protein